MVELVNTPTKVLKENRRVNCMQLYCTTKLTVERESHALNALTLTTTND